MGGTCCMGSGERSDTDNLVNPGTDPKLTTHEELVEHLAKPDKEGRVKISMDMIETILLEEDDPELHDYDHHELKRVNNRKGTGFVTKKQIQAASGKVGFTDDASPAAHQDSEAAQRIAGRKGTGFVSKERLLAVLDELSDDEDAPQPNAADTPQIAPAPNRAKGRKGTGFVTKKKLEKLVNALGEEDEK